MRTFDSPAAFRWWLAGDGATKAEVVVKVFKKHAADQGMVFSQALDEALCAGWINGVRKSLDDDTSSVRFFPRRPKSVWTGGNLKRYQELMAQGRITARGEAAWCDRHAESESRYSHETKTTVLTPELTLEFRKHPKAWHYYQGTPAGYRRASASWVMSAKRDATRHSRLKVLIESSGSRQYIPMLRK